MSSLFAVINKDRPGALEVRVNARPAHVDFLKGLGDKLVFAGPFLDEKGEMCGSLVVIKADDLASAKAIAAADPYVAVDLFASSEVIAWKWSINAPENL